MTTATIEDTGTETVTPGTKKPYWRVLYRVDTVSLEDTLNTLRAEQYYVHKVLPDERNEWTIIARLNNQTTDPLSQLHGIRKQLERLGNIVIATTTKPKQQKTAPAEETARELKASA
jgi:hypothetical protein